MTDSDGLFSICDLPPGTYRVKAWHPILGVQEREVTVTSNDTAMLEVQFDTK